MFFSRHNPIKFCLTFGVHITVSGGGHARPPQHPAGSRPPRVQICPPCPRDQLAAASRVQKAPSCPRDLLAAASRVQNGSSCPRDLLVWCSRVQNRPFCPRNLPAAGQKTLKTVRRRVGGLLPGRETLKTVPAGAGKAECENRRGVGGGSEGWRGRKQAPNLHSSVLFSGNNCYICQN